MKQTFDRNVLVGLVLILALLVGSAAVGYSNTRRLDEDAAWVAHTHEVMDLTSDVLRILVDAETGNRGFLLTGKDEYLQPYDDARQQLDSRIATLQEKTADNSTQQERLKRLKEMAAVRMSLLQQGIALRRQSSAKAQAHVASGKGKKQMDAIRDLITEMRGAEHDLLQKRLGRSRRAYVVAQSSALLAAALGVLMFVVFTWLLRRGLSARQKSAALVEQQREWLRTTLGSIGDAVIATDRKGRVAFLNVVAQTLTGWSEDEAMGQPLEEVFRIVNEKTRQTVENPALRAIKDGIVVGLANHTVLISKDGTERPVDDSAAPIRYDHGRVAGAVLVFRDVTDRRRGEEALRSSREQLAQSVDKLSEANRHKDEFLAMLAHELRNPLAPIRNAVQILHMVGSQDPKQQQVCNMIERQVNHMVRLVDDLMDASRISRGKIELRSKRLNLAEVVESAVETSRPLIAAEKHELAVTLPAQPLHVLGDLTRLAQVVGNLLHNSAKFTPPGGRIWLTVDQEDDKAVLRVRDNGIGIPASMLPQVFELFTQVDRSVERAHGGLGIGLTLAQRLVEMHGGTIEAHSQGEGMGSEFIVRLPLAGEAAERPAPVLPQGKSQNGNGPARRILVVDDNQDSAKSLAMLLRLAGTEVQLAYDGPGALEAAKAFRPDLVLLDIALPGMSGFEIARQLRAQPQFHRLVIAAMTGYSQDEDRRKAKEAGFDCHLTKPLNPETLEALIASPEVFAKTL